MRLVQAGGLWAKCMKSAVERLINSNEIKIENNGRNNAFEIGNML